LNAVVPDDQAFLKFAKQITDIATQFMDPIVPRTEQMADMYLSLSSINKLTLGERATGTGKSAELALMARYLEILENKVLVLVPSEVLKLDQTRCYCTNYCKVEANLYDSSAPAIYYKTFDEVLADGRIPADTMILIDEFHEFMKLPARQTKHGISCPYLFAAAQKVIGLSATFGGDQVKSDIAKLFATSTFLKVP
jgi:superfamily II DNA or RNA helicase